MARQFTADANYLSTTTHVVDYKANYTVAFWLRSPAVSDSTLNEVFHTTNGVSYDTLRVNRFGGTYYWNLHTRYTGDGDEWYSAGNAFAVDTWYHVALVREGTSLLFYVDGVLERTSTQDMSSASDANLTEICPGNWTTSTEFLVEGWRHWNRALTVAELAAEAHSTAPRTRLNLLTDLRLIDGETDGADWSGSGRNFTETGTLASTALRPPVSFDTQLPIAVPAPTPTNPAPTYLGSTSSPADNGTSVATALTVTPPEMTTGCLVVVTVLQRGTATFSVTTTGGQTWNEGTRRTNTNLAVQQFWCVFDGTWDADPVFTSTAGTNTSIVMLVYQPGTSTNTWEIDVAESSSTFTAPSTPFTVTATGQTTTVGNTVSLATWATPDDNTWGSLSGTGWVTTGSDQYRNTSGQDSSLSFAHKIQTSAGATGDVSKNQATLGGDAGLWIVTTWREVGANVTVDVPVRSLTTTKYAPTVTAPNTVTVPLATISDAQFAPTATATADLTVTVPVVSLSDAQFAPTVVTTDDVNVVVPVASLTDTQFAPVVTATDDKTITIPVAALADTQFAPDVQASADRTVTVPAASLALTEYAPTATVPVTTTTLTTAASTYAVGRQHVHFHVRSSTPAVGAMNDRDAQGQWRVRRGNDWIKRENGVLDFGWLGLDGDVVYARAIDRAGNAGEWVSYTFSVAANTAADVVRYLSSSGSDSNDGTTGSPWLTVGHARTQMESLIGSGEVGVLFVAGSATYTVSSAAWVGGTTARLIRFVWDGSGTKPVFDVADGVSAFSIGMRGSVHVEGITIDGLSGTGSENGLDLSRTGGVIGDRSPYNVMLVNCGVQGFFQGIAGIDSVCTQANRDGGASDFLALQDVTFSGTRGWDVMDCPFTRYWLMRNTTHTSGGTNFLGNLRIYSWGDGYAEDVSFSYSGGDVIRACRLNVKPGTEFRRSSWVRTQFLGSDPLGEIWFEHNASEAGVGDFIDVRFYDCTIYPGSWTVKWDNGGASNASQLTRVDWINCLTQFWFVGASAAQSEVHTSMRFRGCAAVRDYQNGQFLLLQGAASKYADDCLQIHGCYVYWPVTTTLESPGGVFINAGGMSEASIAAKVVASDYNHTGKVNSGSTFAWVTHSGGTTSRASWNSSYGFDANSTHTDATTFDLTDNGLSVAADIDVHLTAGTGPLAGTGYPLPAQVAVDIDGFLRDASTPDAGPDEYNAATLPDDPDLSRTIAVPAAEVATTRYAPTVTAPSSETIVVPVAAITDTQFAPSVSVTDNQVVAVPLATATLTEFAPQVSTTSDVLVDVPSASVTETTYSPVVSLTGNVIVSVPLASLTVTEFSPTANASDDQTVPVPVASLTTDLFAPAERIAATIVVPVRSVSTTRYAPSFVTTTDWNIIVPALVLSLSSSEPAVYQTAAPRVRAPSVSPPAKWTKSQRDPVTRQRWQPRDFARRRNWERKPRPR